ncbi:MAG: DUF4238 domain-containing protein [Nitrosomonas sp.]|uniref:DUF4238 domain-containing protein n=1 Tax=Nitrosomonas sp. TaxID=42353 RepID=UPI0032ED0DF8
MKHKSKKHHYVPQSLLKFFSVNCAGKQIYVFDKHQNKAYKSSLIDAGSQNHFNKLEIKSEILNFEEIFNEADQRLANLLNQIHQTRNVSILTANDRRDWADVIAIQLLRTPIMRTTMTQIAADLVDSLAESGLAKVEDFSVPTDNDTKIATVKMFQDRNSMRTALENKDFVLFEGNGSIPFLISDNPVVRCSTVPYGNSGLDSPGVGIYLPLGTNLVLAMLCKSVRASINTQPIEAFKMPKEIIALREGLRTGEPIRQPDSFVSNFNAHQIAGSSRFLYSPCDTFDTVRSVLEAHPKLQYVKSYIKIGQMGQVPPSPRMPEGQWLVLFGQTSHYMLPIQNWQQEICEGETFEIDTLNRALADAPFKEMGYYENKQQCMMMREICIEILTNLAPIRFKIRHTDPALESLDAAIKR